MNRSLSAMLPDRNSKFLRVRKKTFLKTFRISHKVVQTLVNMKKKGETTCDRLKIISKQRTSAGREATE